MIRWIQLTGCATVVAAAGISGCHKEKQIVIVPQSELLVAQAPVPAEPAPAPQPAPAYEIPMDETPAPVYESPAPVLVSPGPVVAPAPVVVEPVVVQPAAAVSVSFFHEKLRTYGRWVTDASYGQVWIPAVVPVGWTPYTVGHWVYTDAYGWTWVSDEPWGWATCHYGRWTWTDSYGWVWLPGTVWGPAWVVWRTGGGYVGWAPMPPDAFVAPVVATTTEVNININVGAVEHIRPHHWVFVEERHFLEPAHKHLVLSRQKDWIMNVTRPSTHIVASHGRLIDRSLAVGDVERAVGKRVPRMLVRDVDATKDTRMLVKGNEVLLPRAITRPLSDTRSGTASSAGTRATTGNRAVVNPPASKAGTLISRKPAAGTPITREPTAVTTPKSVGTSRTSSSTDFKINTSVPPVTNSTRTTVERKVQPDARALPPARSVARSVDPTKVTSNANASGPTASSSDLSVRTTISRAPVSQPPLPATQMKTKTSAPATPPTVGLPARPVQRPANASAAARLGPPPQTSSVGTARRVDISRQGPTLRESRDVTAARVSRDASADRTIVTRDKTNVQAPTAAARPSGQTQSSADRSASIKRIASSNQSGPASASSAKARGDAGSDRTKSVIERRIDRNDQAPR
jgi:hypothetical protein